MILVTGSLAYDIIMNFPGKFSDSILPEKIHMLNVSFLVDKLIKNKGGTAGNIAYSLALLDTPVSILAAAGNDFFEYDSFLKKVGVDTSKVSINKDDMTALAFITTDQSDNQITGFYPGAMNGSESLSVTKSDFVVISPDNPVAMIKHAKECQALKIPYMFDPGMQLPRLTDEDLKVAISGAEILIGNDYEMNLLKSRLWMEDVDLLKQVKIVITTMGEKGAEILSKEGKVVITVAKPNSVSDPTGAGDAFRSGFLAGYMRKFSLKTCGQMGAVASCYTVEKYGTTTHSFTIPEFCKRYEDNFKEKINL